LIEFDVVVAKTNLSMMDYMRVHGMRNRSDDHDLDVVSNLKGNDFHTSGRAFALLHGSLNLLSTLEQWHVQAI
jgi:hypothetical protein